MNPGDLDDRLTDEDVATIKRCRQLSFWRGSVPFTVGSCAAVAFAKNFGYFANRPRLLFPSFALAVVVGYIGGKLSYLGTCKQMFLELNNSRIKDRILSGKDFSNLQAGPVIVNTPVDTSAPKPSNSWTYAQRREYYRNLPPSDSQLSPNPEPIPIPEPFEETRPPRSSFFDESRPSGSYQFDDVYRPREE